MNDERKVRWTLGLVAAGFAILAVPFALELWGRTAPLVEIPPVDPEFTNTAPIRVTGAELKRTGGDASGFDCYACHERGQAVEVQFDEEHRVKLSDMHSDLVMAHGTHNRNNHCFNCHHDQDFELLQTRDGRQVSIFDSTELCGSCHGPTYRDWEGGAHGRTSGFWDPRRGEVQRQPCVACHDPHAPAIPALKPAPGPNPLRR